MLKKRAVMPCYWIAYQKHRVASIIPCEHTHFTVFVVYDDNNFDYVDVATPSCRFE